MVDELRFIPSEAEARDLKLLRDLKLVIPGLPSSPKKKTGKNFYRRQLSQLRRVMR